MGMALTSKRVVTDGENLINQEDRRVELRDDRKRQPYLHPGGVVAKRHIKEASNLRELDNFVKLLCYLLLIHPVQPAGEIDILATCEIRGKPARNLDERSHVLADSDSSFIGKEHSRDY